MFDTQIQDIGSLFRSAQASVPDYAAHEAQRQQLAIQKQQAGDQHQQFGMQVQAAQKEAADEQLFHDDLAGVMTNPTPKAIAGMIFKHPKHAEQMKAGADLLDNATRQADLTNLGEIFSAGTAGNWDAAAKVARARFDADMASGHADPGEEAIVKALESGDDVQRKAALGMVGVHLAATTGVDHFGTVYGAITKGEKPERHIVGRALTDENGNVLYRDPEGPQYREIKSTDADGNETTQIVQVGGSSGGGGRAPGGAASGGKLDAAKAWSFIAPHEGGYAPHDGNGQPVNFGINQGANPDVDVKNLTAEKAQQLFTDRYWKPSGADSLPASLAAVHADTYYINPSRAQSFLKSSGGDPSKYMSMRETWMKSLVAKDPAKYGRFNKAWTSRNADLRKFSSSVGGGDSAPGSIPATSVFTATGRAKLQTPPTGYRWSKDRSQLEPIPGGPAVANVLAPDTIQGMAEQYIAGDKGVMQNLGRGTQGAANIVRLRNAIQANLRSQGMDGKDMAAHMAEFSGLVAGQRTLGTRTANVEMAATEAQKLIPLARQASALVSRSGFVPLAKAEQAVKLGTNDPNLRRFVTATNGVINTYARAISPTGAPTVSDKEHARELLATTYDQPSYNAVLDQMEREIHAARQSPGAVRSEFRHAVTGGGGGTPFTARSLQEAKAWAAKQQPGSQFTLGGKIYRVKAH